MGNQEPDQVLFSDEEMGQYNQMKQAMFQEMPGMSNGPQGILGPNGQPVQSGQSGNSPTGMPVAGNVPQPNNGVKRPAMAARGPGASAMDLTGAPMR